MERQRWGAAQLVPVQGEEWDASKACSGDPGGRGAAVGTGVAWEAMTGQNGGTITARRAPWCVGLLILLAGIFGMHGLSSHAGGIGPEMHPMTPAAVHLGSGAPTHGVPDVLIAGVRDVTESPIAVGAALVQDLPVGDMGATAMCMAVLAVALTMLLRCLGACPALWRYRWAMTSARAPSSPGRDRDSPSLIVLSIQRC